MSCCCGCLHLPLNISWCKCFCISLAGKSPGETVALLLSSSDRALRSPTREVHHRPMAQGMEKKTMSSARAAPNGVYSNSRGRSWSTCVATRYRGGMRCEVQHAKDCCMSIYESCIWHSLARCQMDSLQLILTSYFLPILCCPDAMYWLRTYFREKRQRLKNSSAFAACHLYRQATLPMEILGTHHC